MRNKLITKLFASVLAIAFVTCASQAFADKGHRRGDRADKLARKLNLDDSQTESISSIFENARTTCEDIDSRKLHRQCMKEQRANVDGEIEAVLTEEQKIEFAVMKEKRAERRAEKRARRESRE